MRILLLATLIMTAWTSSAWALRVLSIKDNRALLDLEGESFQPGDRIGARSSDGRARALLEVKQVKGNRAVAAVVKGQLLPEYSVARLGASGGKSSSPSSSSKSASEPRAKDRNSWGLLGGYTMTTMNVKTSIGTTTLTGSSFDFGGYYQMQLDGKISARILGGYETLSAKGNATSAICDNLTTTNCTVDISYLGLEALLRYSFIQSKQWEVWAGGGLGFLFAMSKSSSILDTSKISTNQTIVGSVGLDYHLGRNNYIPLQLDYTMFPDNNTSSANQIIFRFGYGFNF